MAKGLGVCGLGTPMSPVSAKSVPISTQPLSSHPIYNRSTFVNAYWPMRPTSMLFVTLFALRQHRCVAVRRPTSDRTKVVALKVITIAGPP